MPREERHPDAADGPDVKRRGGISVRRLHRDLLDVVEEGIEAGAPEDPDAGGAQAERSLALPEEVEEEEDPSLPPEPPDEDALSPDFFSEEVFSEPDFSEPLVSELLV